MRGAYLVADVRSAEAEAMARVPDGALMARAAFGLAVTCGKWLAGRGLRVRDADVVVLAGSGNNGGDALFAAAQLAGRGAAVTVVALSPAVHGGGVAAVRAAGGRMLTAADDLDAALAATSAADLVLDGIVGIGGSGPLRPAAAALAESGRGRIIAVDLPSGIDPDTGAVADPDACVHAEVTVTFGALKAGLCVAPGREYAGLVHLIDIGLAALGEVPPALWVMNLATAGAHVPRPGPADDKYTRGVVGVVAGSTAYPGAGILCTGAARFGGVGMVRYAGGAPDVVVPRWPDVVPSHTGPAFAGRVQAWVVGPGAGTDAAAKERLAEAISVPVPLLIDADGITLVADNADLRAAVVARTAPTLFTPHAGEFARLGGELDTAGGRVAAVARLAAELDSVILLKGAATVVASAQGPAVVSASGPPDLATAGSGDVLSGLAGSMLAAHRGMPNADAVRDIAAAAAYLHGTAGRLAAVDGRPIVSDDVLAAVPEAIAVSRTATPL